MKKASAKTAAKIHLKRRVQGSMSKLMDFVKNELPNASIEDIEIRLESLESLNDEYKTLDTTLIPPGKDNEYEEFESLYYEIKAPLRKQLKDLTSPNTSPLNETLLTLIENQKSTSQNAKLPKIDIPTFTGEYKDWLPFKDLFSSCIGSRSDLSNSAKLQFLKGTVKGEAAKLINHLHVSDANYTIAWDKLVQRFDKKRHIVSAYMKDFMNQSNCSNSAHSLRRIADTSDQIIRGIDIMGKEAQSRDSWLIFLVLTKLDTETKRAWAEETSLGDFPSFDSFISFLNTRCDALEIIDQTKKGYTTPIRNLHIQTSTCINCAANHPLYKCAKFKGLTTQERRAFVNKNALCFNCLSQGHQSSKCKSNQKCRICKKSHHSTLHLTDSTSPRSIPSRSQYVADTKQTRLNDGQSRPVQQYHQPHSSNFAQDNSKTACTTICKTSQHMSSVVILPTAVVNVRDLNNQLQPCRILLDSGSQASFISEDCLQRLSLRRERSKLIIRGLSSNKSIYTKGKLLLQLASRYKPNQKLIIETHVLDKLTAPQPSQSFTFNEIDILKQYHLADPYFNESHKIDILIGADHFFQVLQDGQLYISKNLPALQNTIFGYIVSGQLLVSEQPHHILSLHANISGIDDTLKKFWEIEELPEHTHTLTDEEQKCEDIFVNTHYVDPTTNRYVVRLPLNENVTLGQSLPKAIACLHSQERKRDKNAKLYEEYAKFLAEYEGLGHMTPIPTHNLNKEVEHMYLPHHAVLKPTSTTTKLRVVFNGAAITTNGTSLNQKLLVGPKTQRDLIDILLSFRTFKIAIVADIEKMYRQILIHPEDRHLQRIIWRADTSQQIKHYYLNTVTYGTSSAPFLATRALNQLTHEFQNQFPLAEQAIKNNFYVDDLLGGANTINETIELHQQLTTLLNSRGFSLSKWNSSSSEFLKEINSTKIADHPLMFDENPEALRVLGLKWIPSTDHFSFEVALPENSILTKRTILSESSRIFDPLGLISPVTILFKILLQKLWISKCDWDDYDTTIANKYKTLRSSLKYLIDLRIPRFLHTNAVHIELHGFSDASELAYAAVIYCRALDSCGHVNITLTISKTKVCPIKPVSIPRLELCAAVLLTKLFKFTSPIINHHQSTQKYAWTDSKVVLSWLSAPPRKWKSFIANRTSFILSHLENSYWSYVKSSENPADAASRGLTPQQLSNHPLWWVGPKWLTEPGKNSSKGEAINTADIESILTSESREKYIDVLHNDLEIDNQIETLTNLLTRFSKLSTIVRILGRCFQFIRYCKTNKCREETTSKKREIWLSTADINNAYCCLCKLSQQKQFYEEIEALKKKQTVKPSSVISSLVPFLDENGLLRVGGRLEQSTLLYNAKHPIILPKQHIFTNLLITHFHQKHLHAQTSLLLNILRQEYWIISCRRLVKTIINKCVICVRQRGQLSHQLMANLPISRLGAHRAFESVGLDYAGPLELLNRKGRGAKSVKGYVALFICCSTRALHLELAGDLSTDTFLSCLKRFIARRGVPVNIYSDNGTNFVGANRLLNEFYKKLKIINQDLPIQHFILDNKIYWHFNPPSAPHFGGLWEAGVKSVKSILRKIINNTKLTYEEMITVLTEIEGLLNSRPLAPINDDVTSLDTLTPAHFLIGHPITSFPESPDCHINIHDRWRLVQRIQHDFWKRWYHDYLTLLQQRPKWQKIQPQLAEGDLVSIKDDNIPTGKWKLGRILKTHKGKDDLIRVVDIRTATGVITRPVNKLCKLPVESSVKTPLNGVENVRENHAVN